MIKAGNYTIQDKGFVSATENINGVPRQALILELPGGIDEKVLEAMCSGPIEVVDDNGQVVQSHAGPFRVVSHGLKLARTSESDDVAALASRVTSLEAELAETKSAKESAQDALASLSERFRTLQASNTSTLKTGTTEKAVASDGDSGV
ncbi:hypothetical protein [Flintibacter porci]|uniref:hypothetical protein n=1 Tax=Flintibacter porci TaxID=3342383 RepID=UPI003F89A53A